MLMSIVGVAGTVRRDERRAEGNLALQEFLRPGRARGIGVEVDGELRRGRAVEDADDVVAAAFGEGGAGREEDRVVLEPVGSGVAVARVVDLDAEASELDPEARPARRAVLVDAVAADTDALAAHGHSRAADRAVEGDDVGFAGGGTAHDVVAAGHGDAGRVVAEVDRARRVRAEEVAVDRVVRAAQADAGVGAADDVAVVRRRSADRLLAAARLDSLVLDAELDGARDVGSDPVAPDDVETFRRERCPCRRRRWRWRRDRGPRR